MLWKNKNKEVKEASSNILGMIMLQNESAFPFEAFISDYNKNYSNKIEEPSGDDTSAACTIDEEMVAMGCMPIPIPPQVIEHTAPYAYNWPNVSEEVKEHKNHIIVSMLGGSNDVIKRFKIFTQVVCSLLRCTDAIGVYMGNQSLLIPKEDYLEEASFMSDDYLPLNLWVYFGFRVSDKGNSGYTYGLKELGKTEMEVLNSSRSIEDIRGFLFNIAHYVLENDVTFQDGQTCGLSEEEKIAITLSKGNHIECETFKLAY